MKHAFRVKAPIMRSIFLNKLEFKSLSIENNDDVYNTINTILGYTELDQYLEPTDCSYSYLNKVVEFKLELKPEIDKKEFFNSVKKFENFMDM